MLPALPAVEAAVAISNRTLRSASEMHEKLPRADLYCTRKLEAVRSKLRLEHVARSEND
jgi:hypothetical protein